MLKRVLTFIGDLFSSIMLPPLKLTVSAHEVNAKG